MRGEERKKNKKIQCNLQQLGKIKGIKFNPCLVISTSRTLQTKWSLLWIFLMGVKLRSLWEWLGSLKCAPTGRVVPVGDGGKMPGTSPFCWLPCVPDVLWGYLLTLAFRLGTWDSINEMWWVQPDSYHAAWTNQNAYICFWGVWGQKLRYWYLRYWSPKLRPILPWNKKKKCSPGCHEIKTVWIMLIS